MKRAYEKQKKKKKRSQIGSVRYANKKKLLQSGAKTDQKGNDVFLPTTV